MAAHVVGLDLGKTSDFSALAAIEQFQRPHPDQRGHLGESQHHYLIGHLQRWQLGTPYPVVVKDVCGLMAQPPLPGSVLVVDQTGVGQAVVDMFRVARPQAWLRPVTITAGNTATEVPEEFGWHVPKKELVSTLQVLMQGRRLRVAPLPEGVVELLKRELETFRVKITAAANETFGAMGTGQNDDIVLAVAIALWIAEHTALGWKGEIGLPGGKEGRGNCAAAGAPAGVFDDVTESPW
jgi:hypothetical protein